MTLIWFLKLIIIRVAVQYCTCMVLFCTEPVSLWNDNGRRNSPPQQQQSLCRWVPDGPRTRQLSPDIRCVSGKPHRLPLPSEDRALRLSAHHKSRNTASEGRFRPVTVKGKRNTLVYRPLRLKVLRSKVVRSKGHRLRRKCDHCNRINRTSV